MEVASFFLSVHTGFLAEEGAASLVVDNMFMAGFAGYVALRSVFLYSSAGAPFVVDNGDMCMADFAGDDAYHAVFPLFLGRPKILGILFGMEVKDSLQ